MNRLITVLSILLLTSVQQQTLAEPNYIPFPKGYGYNENLEALQKATNKGDRKVIREHAWSLWAGIMQPAEGLGWPLWYTWPNTHAAFSTSGGGLVGKDHKSKMHSRSMLALNRANAPDAANVNTKAPTYNIPLQVIHQYPDAVCSGGTGLLTFCDGKTFLNNGDIMIPTESLSKEAMADIRNKKLYLKSTLDAAHKKGEHMISVSEKFIVTKHMYWPVKAKGVTAIPVWKDNFPDSFTGYAGYEKWDTLIALSPDGKKKVGETVIAEFLYGVLDYTGHKVLPTVVEEAKVYSLEDFYYHKVTKQDWDSFDKADKAIITAASLWANNKPFEVGDYLVTVAMHVNTKELPSWTLQSVWWSDIPNEGPYATYRPKLPQAKGPWQHYLLTDAYAVPKNAEGKLDKAVNPYIEGVIHPIATSCRNCHVRAGWPTTLASYQNPTCPDLLAYLTPESECLKPISLTDYLWIIPDRAQ